MFKSYNEGKITVSTKFVEDKYKVWGVVLHSSVSIYKIFILTVNSGLTIRY